MSLFEMDDPNAELRAKQAKYDAMGADAKRTYRNNLMLDQGVHPTTKRTLIRALSEEERMLRALLGVTSDATCADCRFCQSMSYHNRSFVKCRAVAITHGPGSDTRKKWPACTRFEARR